MKQKCDGCKCQKVRKPTRKERELTSNQIIGALILALVVAGVLTATFTLIFNIVVL